MEMFMTKKSIANRKLQQLLMGPVSFDQVSKQIVRSRQSGDDQRRCKTTAFPRFNSLWHH